MKRRRNNAVLKKNERFFKGAKIKRKAIHFYSNIIIILLTKCKQIANFIYANVL